MARKRRGSPVSGWLVIDKPAGITSAHAVAQARRIMDAAKVGHAGTLDPLATGVLPLAFGEATKTTSYVMDGAKRYAFTIRWGESRTTEDSEGDVVETSSARPSREEIEAVLPAFTGVISQIPPIYSAIKVDGKRAYALARANEEVELAARDVRVGSLVLVDLPDTDHARLELSCGKGTYVRSLARDIAVRLGTVGYVATIRRTRSGPFTEEQAISLDKLEEVGHIAPPHDLLLPVETALDDIPALALSEAQADHLRQGRPVRVLGAAGRPVVDFSQIEPGTVARAMSGPRVVALVRFHGEEIRPIRVLNH